MKMKDEAGRDEGASAETVPIEVLEKAVADMLDGKRVGAAFWDNTLKDFRKALDAARRESVWEIVDLAFGHIVAVSTEMLVRSQLAMRMRMELLTKRRGAEHFPDVREEAGRVERTARFLLEAAVQYAKVRHVSSILRRQGDPKIVDFQEAREKMARKETDDGPEEKAEVVEA
jgi:hypothetical protein